MKRWYEESSSEGIRKWAEDYVEFILCTECKGSRLKQEALQFKIANKDIAELAQLNIEELGLFIRNANTLMDKKTAGKLQKMCSRRLRKDYSSL